MFDSQQCVYHGGFGAKVTTVSSRDKVSELSAGTDHSAVSHSL